MGRGSLNATFLTGQLRQRPSTPTPPLYTYHPFHTPATSITPLPHLALLTPALLTLVLALLLPRKLMMFCVSVTGGGGGGGGEAMMNYTPWHYLIGAIHSPTFIFHSLDHWSERSC